MTAKGPRGGRFVQVIEDLLRGGHPVRFRAPGWSMHPTIHHGDLITVAPLGASPVRVGDVVLYCRGRAAIAHRVIGLHSGPDGSGRLVLRGDAAISCDRPVERARVLGRVVAVERAPRPGTPEISVWLRSLLAALVVPTNLVRGTQDR